jgi:predicted  nucleic acid-binding Zn-ribbon protein
MHMPPQVQELSERVAGAEAEQQLVSNRYQEESGHLAAQLAVYKAEVDELKQAVLDAQAERQEAQETVRVALLLHYAYHLHLYHTIRRGLPTANT